MKTNAPGAVSSLVCGIIAVVLCWIPVAGIILGVIAIIHSRKAKVAVQDSPDLYEGTGIAIGGLVCGIVGTAVSGVYNLIYLLLTVAGSQQGSW